MGKIFQFFKKLTPKKVFAAFQPIFHYLLALIGATVYRSPSRQIKVIDVTGTKGKSSVVEILTAILETTGREAGSASTIKFKIDERTERNLYKMTCPAAFLLKSFCGGRQMSVVNTRCWR